MNAKDTKRAKDAKKLLGVAKIGSMKRVVMPDKVLQHLGVDEGDLVMFLRQGKGKVLVKKVYEEGDEE